MAIAAVTDPTGGGTRVSQPIARVTAPGPNNSAAAATATGVPTSLTAAEQQAANDAAAVLTGHGTGNQAQAKVIQDLTSWVPYGIVTQADVDAAANDLIQGTGAWGNGAVNVQQLFTQIDNAVGAAITQAPAPVVPSDPGQLVPRGGGVTATPIPSPISVTTVGGGGDPTTTQSTGGTTTDPLTTILQYLQGLSGANVSGSGATGSGSSSGGDGEVAGTSTPISSLGALTPIGTPTSTSSSGAPVMAIAVAVIAAGGVGVWIFEKNHKKKTATNAPPVQRAA